ncbi:PH domain-containing protein [Leptospira sp. 201903071]|nr:PH domain-containing protein [Leptospira ainazelensis]
MATKTKNYSIQDIKLFIDEQSNKLNEILEQIKLLPIDNLSTLLGRQEISELPNILAQNEKLNNLIQGKYNDREGILVSTNNRLIFIDKGLIYGLKVESFPLDQINSIQYETGAIYGTVIIHTAGNTARIDRIFKLQARKFSESVQSLISNKSKNGDRVNPIESDIYDKLEKLGTLKDKGILSESEFAKEKEKLLGKEK